jgi:Flp pilus assembly protein TadG
MSEHGRHLPPAAFGGGVFIRASRMFARRVRRDESGATAVEFSLLAVPFMGLVFFIMEHGYNTFIVSSLDTATDRVARQIMIGNAQAQRLTLGAVRTQICDEIRGGTGCPGRMFVSVRGVQRADFFSNDSIVQFNDARNSFCPGGGGQYTVVSVVYAAPTISRLWFGSEVTINGERAIALRSTRVIRNEPFSNPGVSC